MYILAATGGRSYSRIFVFETKYGFINFVALSISTPYIFNDLNKLKSFLDSLITDDQLRYSFVGGLFDKFKSVKLYAFKIQPKNLYDFFCCSCYRSANQHTCYRSVAERDFSDNAIELNNTGMVLSSFTPGHPGSFNFLPFSEK